MEVRPLRSDDADTLLAFFAGVPEHERTFFKEEVLDPGTVEGWLRDQRGARAIACEHGGARGGAGLPRGPGASPPWRAGSVRGAGVGPGRRAPPARPPPLGRCVPCATPSSSAIPRSMPRHSTPMSGAVS